MSHRFVYILAIMTKCSPNNKIHHYLRRINDVDFMPPHQYRSIDKEMGIKLSSYACEVASVHWLRVHLP